MATESEPKKGDRAAPRGLRRLRRVPQAGHPRLLRPRLEEPARQLHRARHRLGPGDLDGGRLDQGRHGPQEGGARRRRASSRCASACATRSSGPLGVILTGAAAVSLASYLIKNQKEITDQGVDLPRRSSPRRARASRRRRAATARAATTPRAATSWSTACSSASSRTSTPLERAVRRAAALTTSISDLRPPTEKRTSRLERRTFSILPRPYSACEMISPAL